MGADVSVELAVPIGTFQIDECVKPVKVDFSERDYVGQIYHQNAPGLSLGYAGVNCEAQAIGISDDVQHVTWMGPIGLLTNVVVRGEREFPIDPACTDGACAAPLSGDRRLQAELKRESGNAMFRANDFMQAAMEYTAALELDPTIDTLYANRSQCWLKLGNHEKAFDDALKCTEFDPSNAKGWFRKGMSLHAMERYAEAIPDLLEAEKLEPKSKQISEAIRMAQLMARRQAMGA